MKSNRKKPENKKPYRPGIIEITTLSALTGIDPSYADGPCVSACFIPGPIALFTPVMGPFPIGPIGPIAPTVS